MYIHIHMPKERNQEKKGMNLIIIIITFNSSPSFSFSFRFRCYSSSQFLPHSRKKGYKHKKFVGLNWDNPHFVKSNMG